MHIKTLLSKIDHQNLYCSIDKMIYNEIENFSLKRISYTKKPRSVFDFPVNSAAMLIFSDFLTCQIFATVFIDESWSQKWGLENQVIDEQKNWIKTYIFLFCMKRISFTHTEEVENLSIRKRDQKICEKSYRRLLHKNCRRKSAMGLYFYGLIFFVFNSSFFYKCFLNSELSL